MDYIEKYVCSIKYLNNNCHDTFMANLYEHNL